jgi:hypothetical protein
LANGNGTPTYTRVHGNATRACQRCRITVSWSNVHYCMSASSTPNLDDDGSPVCERIKDEVVTGQGRQLSPTSCRL